MAGPLAAGEVPSTRSTRPSAGRQAALCALRLTGTPAVIDGDQPVPDGLARAGLAEAQRRLDAPGKALVAVFTGRDLPGTLAYLAALAMGHAVLLKESGDPASRQALLESYQPEYVIDAGAEPVPAGYHQGGSFLGARVLTRSAGAGLYIHPELAVLVTTSGSLGRPKAVRLSYSNVSANAHSIISALGIGRSDTGITSLPTDYSFGLSIVNTHLLAGARLVLSRLSPVSRQFWRLSHRTGVTNLGAVPVSYRILHDMRWQASGFPALRLAYQAGGALEPDIIRHFGQTMAANQGGFCPMYGATEATARMTCLAPELLFDYLGSVGTPVPGGRVWLRDAAEDGVGEVVYSGPNVMMGYARSRSDLSRGDVTGDVLITGDLGYLDRGMLYVVGRKDRQVKLYGRRIAPEDVERQLARIGAAAVIPVSGDHALVFVEGSAEPFRGPLRDVLRALNLPVTCLRIQALPSLPRTGSGKVDISALRALAGQRAGQPQRSEGELSHVAGG